jgi:hypothetical protein
MAASEAITLASELEEIGFPEFTCKLITDVFDALISANLRQMTAHAEFLSSTAKTLQGFINDTKDDISAEELLSFLIKLLPNDNDGTLLTKENTQTISQEDRKKINDALSVTDGDEVIQGNVITTTESVTYADMFGEICKAAAIRIAANKYDLLLKMMKMGLMRLVVESGSIETNLDFKTEGYSYNSEDMDGYITTTTSTTTTVAPRVIIPSFFSILARNMAASRRTTINVRTTTPIKKSTTSFSSADTHITGRVVINFKTDYMPLDQA